ncbi:MAG: hypothetical protein JWR69_1240 [Pedosphaera sp.]|nr:hypothetical protein [Pedosphaera sp.]
MPLTPSKLPTKLIVVSALFFIEGLYGIYREISNLVAGSPFIALDILGLFIAWGIFRLYRGWRILGLTFLWISFVWLLHAFFSLLAQVVTGQISSASWMDFAMPSALVTVAMLANFWMIHVLTSNDVRKLFGAEAKDAA